MSKSNYTETDLLEYTFKATAFPWNSNTNLYIALHTADPGEAGDQTTSETAYGSYARVAVARSGSGWTVTGNTAQNAALIQFPQCSSGSSTITYFSIGTASSGAGQILYSGQLGSPLSVSSGIQPQFAATSISVVED